MNNPISEVNVLRGFPYELSTDDNINALATATVREFMRLYRDNDLLAIYTRIDELDEALLDILAEDYKVDWYMYNGTVASKRNQIKSHFEVHRHLGTKAAMLRALGDIFPESLVEEWLEYGGTPYHFRVILDLTQQTTPITISLVERMIRIFKSARSVLDEDSIMLRTRCTILVGVSGHYAYFTARKTGTYPKPAVQGVITPIIIEESVDNGWYGFTAPKTDQLTAGTFPKPAMQGAISSDTLIIAEDGNGVVYRTPAADELNVGSHPRPAMQGGKTSETIAVSSDAENSVFTAPSAGTVPSAAMQGGIHSDAVTLSSENGSAAYSAQKAGTIPDAAVNGAVEGGNISFDSFGGSADINARVCGTPNGSLF